MRSQSRNTSGSRCETYRIVVPPLLQLAQDVEQVIGLRVGERGRRLVEHEDPAIERQRAGDLEQLAMRGRERFGERVRIDPQRQSIEHRSRARAHRRFVEPAEAADLAAAEDVGRDAEVGQAQHLLVDHADAVLDGLARARRRERLSAPADLAAIGPDQPGEDLQQRRLAGAVLADERVRLALRHIEADAAQGVDGAKGFLNAVELQTHSSQMVAYGSCFLSVRLDAGYCLHCRYPVSDTGDCRLRRAAAGHAATYHSSGARRET